MHVRDVQGSAGETRALRRLSLTVPLRSVGSGVERLARELLFYGGHRLNTEAFSFLLRAIKTFRIDTPSGCTGFPGDYSPDKRAELRAFLA